MTSTSTPSSRFGRPGIIAAAVLAVVLLAGGIYLVARPEGDRDIGPIPDRMIEQDPTGTGPLVAVIGDSIADSARGAVHLALDDHATLVGAVPAEGFAGGPYSKGALGEGDPLMVRTARRYGDLDPTVAVIALGTNDAWNDELALDRSLAGLDDIVATLDGACLVVVLPQATAETQPTYDTEKASTIRDRLEAVADEVVRWDEVTAATPGLLVDDGVHLTEAGQLAWGANVAEAVRRCEPT